MEISQLPVRPLINPLNSEDEATLRKILHNALAHSDLIERAKACGMDMSEHEARNEMHKHVAGTMIKLFFPPNLTPPDSSNAATS